MNNVLVSYETKNAIASGLMAKLAMTKGVEIDYDTILTPSEWERVKKSEQSGYADLDELMKFLSQ